MARINIEGRQIGMLTVIEKMPYAENSYKAMYKCRCQCGNEYEYERGKLLKCDYVACYNCCMSVSSSELERLHGAFVLLLLFFELKQLVP